MQKLSLWCKNISFYLFIVKIFNLAIELSLFMIYTLISSLCVTNFVYYHQNQRGGYASYGRAY